MDTLTAAVHVGFLLVSALTTAGLAVYAWRRRPEPGARPFISLMVTLTVWSACYAVALSVSPSGSRVFWEKMQWLGIPFVSVSMLWFGFAYTGYDELLTRGRLAALSVVPAVTVVLAWTNEFHHLVWTDQRFVESSGLILATQEFGAWYWFHLLYAYALILVGVLALVRLVVVSEYLYRDQAALLLVGVAIPFVGNALSVFAVTPLPGLDLTPYALTVTGVAFGHALFRYRLLDLVPGTRHIGRNVAISSLDDGVVIVDDARQVVYCNEAASDILDREQRAILGEELTEHISAPVDLDTEDALAEFSREGRTYEVRSSTVTDQHDRRIGNTLVITDITERKRREETLRRQRDELETLDRINRVIRGVNQALIGATTREEIERSVPEHLVDSPLYDVACVGLGATGPDEVTCVADEEATDLASSEAVVAAAMQAGRNAADADLDRDALVSADAGADQLPGAWTTVPLVYERTIYGVLVVYSNRPDAFGERELSVLDELGRSIGDAINAIERRQLLHSDAVVEIELQSTDERSALVRVSEGLDCRLVLEGVVPVEEGRLLAYLAVEDEPPDAVANELTAADGVDDSRVLSDGGVVECTLDGGSLLSPVTEYGGNVRSASVESGRCELVVEVAPDTDVRGVVERVRESYPDTTLQSKREREPADATDALPEEALAELTDRQQEVLETAYLAGYFDWPRESTAEEVADSLDIASPTLHNHLRKAQKKVLTELIGDEDR